MWVRDTKSYICVSGVDNFGDVPILNSKEGYHTPSAQEGYEQKKAEAVSKTSLGYRVLPAVFVGLPVISIFVPLKLCFTV